MGGRGSGSLGSASGSGFTGVTAAERAALPYEVISYDDTNRGGAQFPFLKETGRAWHLLTWPVEQLADYHPAHTFGLAQPTLRWVNGSQVNDLYVDGMETAEFLAATGLQLDMGQGGFVLSKRLSRLLRPYFVSGFFDPGEVTIGYLDQTPVEAKVWDGAGLISRRLLRKMVLSDNLSPARRARLEGELRHARRVEFTVLTAEGQDKGHAIVADDLRDEMGRPVDFLLPQDTKREVKLAGGQTFVGLNFVHSHNHMRLDIQSLINLYPFFEEAPLLGWLQEEGELFVRSVESGDIRAVMGRIDRHTALDELQRWPLREYLASGGQPVWFNSHVKALMNQHLRRLNDSTLAKMRLPIPGGRFYVMPAAVGRRAGLRGLAVPRGHIQLDGRAGTAWVNEEDWLALSDSPKGVGIAGILGGADNDDALWVHPFTDYDGERMVLAWRSPNQAGEYVVLRPTAGSEELPWATAEGEAVVYPAGDSRQLPPRVDQLSPEYLHLVEPVPSSPAVPAYSIEAMAAAVSQAIANKGALGMYCNSLMLNKALLGGLPENPPAPLEDIIDAAVKTGADLSQVVLWNYANSRQLLEQRVPIPGLLHNRLSIDWRDKENPPSLPRWSGVAGHSDHWLDRLERGVRAHIAAIEQQRDELAQQARPPQTLFAAMAGDEEAIRLGAGYNQTFAAALNRKGKGEYGSRLERARQAAEDYLAHFPPARRGAILRGALVSVYSGERSGSDAAVWLAAGSGLAGAASIGQQTIEGLRDIGVLDDILNTKVGLVAYPAGFYLDESESDDNGLAGGR